MSRTCPSTRLLLLLRNYKKGKSEQNHIFLLWLQLRHSPIINYFFFFKQTQNYWRRANFFLIFLNLKCLELSLQVASINLDWETKNYSQHWQTPLIYLFIYRLRMQFYRDFKCLFPLSKSIIKLLKLDQRSCPKGLSIESMTGSTSTIQSTGRMAQSHHSRKWVVFFSSLYKCI